MLWVFPLSPLFCAKNVCPTFLTRPAWTFFQLYSIQTPRLNARKQVPLLLWATDHSNLLFFVRKPIGKQRFGVCRRYTGPEVALAVLIIQSILESQKLDSQMTPILRNLVVVTGFLPVYSQDKNLGPISFVFKKSISECRYLNSKWDLTTNPYRQNAKIIQMLTAIRFRKICYFLLPGFLKDRIDWRINPIFFLFKCTDRLEITVPWFLIS